MFVFLAPSLVPISTGDSRALAGCSALLLKLYCNASERWRHYSRDDLDSAQTFMNQLVSPAIVSKMWLGHTMEADHMAENLKLNTLQRCLWSRLTMNGGRKVLT